MFDTYIIAKLNKLEKLSYERFGSYSYVTGAYSSLLADLLSELSTREQVIERIDTLISQLESV